MRDDEGFFQFLSNLAAEDADICDETTARRRLVAALYAFQWTTHSLIKILCEQVEDGATPDYREVVQVWETLMQKLYAAEGIEWVPPITGAY
jgi:hypothetical protein